MRALVALGIAALSLARSRGMRSPWVLTYTLAMGWLIWELLPARCERRSHREPPQPRDLTWLCVGFLAFLALQPGPIYWAHPAWPWIFSAGAALTAALVALKRWPLAAAASLLLIVMQGLVLVASPSPAIDVFTIAREAIHALLHGLNPYTHTYTDIYNGAFGYQAGFGYPPGGLLFLVPTESLLGDQRWTYVAANIASAALIWRRTRSWLGVLALLSLPTTFFVLEQAWIDTLLLTWILLALTARAERRPALLGLSFALLVSTKQYGAAVVWFLTLDAWREARWQLPWPEIFRATGIFAIGLVAFYGPFVVADFDALWLSTVTHPVEMKLRPDAFSWPALWLRWLGWQAPDALLTAFGAACGVLVTWGVVWRGLKPAPALLCFFTPLFLFGKVSFCNYHHFLLAIGVWAIVTDGEYSQTALDAPGSDQPAFR